MAPQGVERHAAIDEGLDERRVEREPFAVGAGDPYAIVLKPAQTLQRLSRAPWNALA